MSWDRVNGMAAQACGIAPRSANGWPTVEVVPAAPKLTLTVEVQSRPVISRHAIDYHRVVAKISSLLAQSAVALADHDYVTADNLRHEAWTTFCGSGELIALAEDEVCLPTDACEECGAPSAHRCSCDDDVRF